MRFFKLIILILFLCSGSSCAGKEIRKDPAARASLGMDQIVQALIDREWPMSPDSLASDLAVKFERVDGASGFQQIFRTPSLITSDGYTIEYVEYRLPDLNHGQMIRYVRIPLSHDHCYSVPYARRKFSAKSEHIMPPEHGSSGAGSNISYSREMGGYRMSLWTSDARKECVESISFEANPQVMNLHK